MKKLHFIILVFGLFACNSKTQDNNLQEESEETIIIVDTHESDSIRMWKELAEESIERARRDATIIKELLPRARKMIENKSYENAFSKYLEECEVESAENVIKNNMELMYYYYNKKNYKAVISPSDMIENTRIKIQSIIEI